MAVIQFAQIGGEGAGGVGGDDGIVDVVEVDLQAGVGLQGVPAGLGHIGVFRQDVQAAGILEVQLEYVDALGEDVVDQVLRWYR